MIKNVWKWIIGLLVFALVIGGAYLLYDTLKDRYMPERLMGTSESSQVSSIPENASEPAVSVTKESARISSEEQSAAESEGNETELNPAPDFHVTDYEGNQVKLSDYFGKPIVLNFWASWCPPCKSEMPDFNEAYQEHEEIQFLMVNLTDGGRETVDSAKEHVESNGFSFPVLFDTEYEAASAYGISSIPSTYFLDKEGNLIAVAVGAIDKETLEKGIEMIKE